MQPDNDQRLAALGRTIGSFAHDLRGPLGTMRQVIDVLRDGEDIGMSQEDLIEMLDSSVVTINRLIDQCLAYSKGSPPLSIVKGTWDLLLASEFGIVKQEIDGRGVDLQLMIDGSCPLEVDPNAIGQVLQTLCRYSAEAVKRQPDAQITLAVDSGSNTTLLRITDNGEGMSPELTERFFQPFAHKSRGVSGLELAIAKQIIDAHGGTISIEAGDQGTQFKIALPAS